MDGGVRPGADSPAGPGAGGGELAAANAARAVVSDAAKRRTQTVILGGPGTGKTARVLAAAQEAAPATASTAGAEGPHAFVVAVSTSAAAALATRAGSGFAPRIVTIPALALLVLREAAGRGQRAPRLVGRSERLAMLHEFIAGKDVASGAPTAADLLARIDRLARHGVDAERIAAWADALADGPFAARQREFASLALRHDALLRDRGLMSSPNAVLAARRALATTTLEGRISILAVDDAQELAPAEVDLLLDLARAAGAPLVFAADDDQAPRSGEAAAAPIRAVLQHNPDGDVMHLERSQRVQSAVAQAAEILASGAAGRMPRPPLGADEGGEIELHESAGSHEQASAVAARVAASLQAGRRPERIAVACVDPARDARAIALALEARGVSSDAIDLDSDADRPEVRDLLAWFRLLLDPADAGAVVRALSRPPVGLPGSDLARVVRVARRQRLNLIEAARGALDGPGLEPRSRERAHDFLALVDRFAPRIDEDDAGRLVRDLVAALGLHRRQLAATGPDARAAVRALQRVEVAAAGHVARAPDASPREVLSGVAALLDAGALPEPHGENTTAATVRIVGVRVDELRSLDVDELHLVGLDEPAVLALDHEPPEPLLGEQPSTDLGRARRLLSLAITRARSRVVVSTTAGEPSRLLAELSEGLGLAVAGAPPVAGEEQALLDAAGILREQLSTDIARAAAGLRDLRLDGDIELTATVARVLELVKVAALLGRDDDDSSLADAITAVNSRIAAITSPLQRELIETSDLDARLIEGRRLAPGDGTSEPSMAQFLPRRGAGIGLSATDISTYLACPLQYKFGRVLKVPRPQTVQQRFGIAVHQAIERFHVAGGGHLTKLLGLLDAAWRTGGLGTDEESLQFRARAERALRDYHQRLTLDAGEPVYIERPFEFHIGRHGLRGRVDRVDRLPDGGYELIDIKTGPPRDAADLQRDVQLALYDLAAREHWRIEPTLRSYYYVLDDVKVQLPAGVDAAWVTDTVEQVGAGIEAEQFDPTPSPKACGWCDFQLACPAAER